MSFSTSTALAILIATFPLAAAEPARLTGTATYRERIALEPGAVLEVALLDVSRADAPSVTLSAMRIAPETQVPIAFSLYYDPALIQPEHTYSVSAKLLSGDRVLFRSVTLNPVLTRGAGETVEIVMMRATSTAALVGPEWIAEGIGDAAESYIRFTAQGRAEGSGGCNSFGGSYVADSEAFAIGNLASTLRACAEPIMQQEGRFHQALRQVRTYKIENGLLVFYDESAAAVLRLRPRTN